jgi:transposase InsO family protein
VPEEAPAAAPAPDLESSKRALPLAGTTNGVVEDATVAAALASFHATCRGQEEEHLDRLRPWLGDPTESCPKCQRPAARRRSRARRQARREARQKIRAAAAACSHDLGERGYTQEESAALLGMPLRRLRHWDFTCRIEQVALLPVGRPALPAPVAARQPVLDFLQEHGPGVGVPRLSTAFPELSRAVLTDLVQRYRAVVQACYRTCVRELQWPQPGTVWAIDFAEPSRWGEDGVLPPIAGQWPYVLAVRDLASGYQLAWLPVAAATAAVTTELLARLFAEYGAPLVLKADNGPPFRAEQTKVFLESRDVQILYSPPYWPGYNGAIEAAIGSLKRRTEAHAAAQGHAGQWTTADLEAARQAANNSRPRRLHGRTPAQVWAARKSLSAVERVCFELAVQRERFAAANEYGLDLDSGLDHWQQARLHRKAIERALVGHAYLLFKGRRVPLTIKAGKVTTFV